MDKKLLCREFTQVSTNVSLLLKSLDTEINTGKKSIDIRDITKEIKDRIQRHWIDTGKIDANIDEFPINEKFVVTSIYKQMKKEDVPDEALEELAKMQENKETYDCYYQKQHKGGFLEGFKEIWKGVKYQKVK